MRSRPTSFGWLPFFAAAGALAWPAFAQGQAFSADYGLGSLRIQAASQSSLDFYGAGLSVAAGRTWFGQVGMGRSLPDTVSPAGAAQVVSLAGGYRFGGGQSLSLQLSRGRGSDPRPGLAVNYDWPRYFVRLSYDTRMSLQPQDHVRLSAGLRF
jgi:hypothetical protein